MKIADNLKKIKNELPQNLSLVAVSKTKSIPEMMEAYNAGQRIFGENKVQEMESKWREMPEDVEWHMVGHVQRNKVKFMAPFVTLVHAVDRLKLLKEINKEAKKNERIIKCLLQIKIAQEESKYGMEENEALQLLESEAFKNLKNIEIVGLMGMATFTTDEKTITAEFSKLNNLFKSLSKKHNLTILSMGMSGDYKLAIENGSTMVRIGSTIFGERGN